MQTTGISIFYNLPQVKNFSFSINEINVSDLNPVSFKFYDTGNISFSFDFESGFIKTDKIIYLYNTKENINIEGYLKNSKLYYKINDVTSEKNIDFLGEPTNFSYLDKILIKSSGTEVNFNIFINSNPINYSFEVEPNYSFKGALSGKIKTNTPFNIKDYSLLFYNSNLNLLSGENNMTGKVFSGENIFTLKDIDNLNLEYNNPFLINFNTIFGILQQNFSSYRGGFYSNKIINIIESPLNNYSSYSLFDGIWSGNRFIYTGDATVLDLFFNLENIDYLGNEIPISGEIRFDLFSPYRAKYYITGFQLTNSGLYSGQPPTLSFPKYYYVEGISQNFQDLLFSSGCSNKILINYSGSSSEGASGYLKSRDVYVNGIYGNGINKFKAIFGYTPYSSGDGYTGAPVILWGTGGECYSLPDIYGESGQFKKINGTKANIKAHADYAVGYPLTSGITGLGGLITGFVVTGITMTNLGSGYYNPILGRSYPQIIHFNRSEGDLLNNDASGYFTYLNEIDVSNNFPNFNISYNFLDANEYNLGLRTSDNVFTGLFSKPYGKNVMNIKIKHNLDYVNPVYAGLYLKMQNNNIFNIFTTGIILDKTYDPDPSALI